MPDALLLPDREASEVAAAENILQGSLQISTGLYPKGLSLPFEDDQDQLPVAAGAPPLFSPSEENESRQCLRLHVGRVFADATSSAQLLALSLRAELWERPLPLMAHRGVPPL